jgi:hypothetical protein
MSLMKATTPPTTVVGATMTSTALVKRVTLQSILADPILNNETLWERLHERAELGKFQASIGSTTVANNDYLESDDETAGTNPSTDDDDSWPGEIHDEEILDGLMEGARDGEIDLDKIMASAIQGRQHQRMKPEHLSKIWRINIETAKRTLDATSQTSARTDNPKIAKNYGTNDRMPRYKRINDYFFMDTFFVTKTAGKSSRGHSCCQLFVTDKGFVYGVPMRRRSLASCQTVCKRNWCPRRDNCRCRK